MTNPEEPREREVQTWPEMLRQSAQKHATVCRDLANKTPVAGEPDSLWWERQSALREASVILAHVAALPFPPAADAAMVEALRLSMAKRIYWADVKHDDHEGNIRDEWRDSWWETNADMPLSGKPFLARWLTLADAALDLASRQPAGVGRDFELADLVPMLEQEITHWSVGCRGRIAATRCRNIVHNVLKPFLPAAPATDEGECR